MQPCIMKMRLKEKDVRVGDTIIVQRAGDVIPQVVSVDMNKRPKNSKKYIFPNTCLCGSKIKRNLICLQIKKML